VYGLGEVFNGDVGYVSSYQNQAVDGVFSYPLAFTVRDVFGNKKSMNALEDALGPQGSILSYPDPDALGTFVDNHDNARFLSFQSDATLYHNALTLVLTTRGIPVIYYGSEQGFHGGNDPANREVMWGHYDTSADSYKLIATIIAHRKASTLYGDKQIQRYATDTFYAFTRGDTLVCLTNVGSNGGDVTQNITYQPFPDGTVLCDVLDETVCVTVTGGAVSVTLNGGRPRVLFPHKTPTYVDA